MKKKVTIISNYYYPDVASIANLYKQLSEFLSKDMVVTVICAVPCYLGDIPDEYKNGKYFFGEENGIRIIRIGVPEFNKSNRISRVKNLFYFINGSIKIASRLGKQDVIIAVSQPPVFGGYIGYRIKRKTKAKLIYNIQDFNPEQMEYSGFSKNPLIIRMLKAFDVFLCRNSDHIIVVSDDMKKTLISRLKGKKIPPNTVINNWVDTKQVKNVLRSNNPLVGKYDIHNDDFLVVYAGNIGVMQNLKTFLYAAKELEHYEKIKFVFIGGGAWKNELENMINELGLRNVLLQPYEPIDNIDLVYSLGDIEIVSIGPNVTKCSMPSKTWNILACGVPVICQVDAESELNSLINENKVGFTVPPDDYYGVSNKILELYNNDQLRKVMGENARELAEKDFDLNVSVNKYKGVINELIKS